MKALLRPSNRIKPIGTTSEVYKSSLDKVAVGELVEITNRDMETLNIAKVIETKNNTIVIEMIA